jgi:hypothetical protein
VPADDLIPSRLGIPAATRLGAERIIAMLRP